MMEPAVRAAIRQRVYVLGLAVIVSCLGVYALRQLPIDAYPDISAQLVQVITVFPGRASEEVERQVTIPIEISMRGVPRAEVVRSRSIFGLSVVQVIFQEGTEMYWARQRVQERLSGVALPESADSELGPLATAYGEVFRYILEHDGSFDAMALRELNDWVVIPRLLRTPGVAEVSNFGGRAKQFTVTFKPSQLDRYSLTLNQVIEAIRSNNASAGGSVVPRGSMGLVVRSQGSLENIGQLESIFIKTVGGTPTYVKDVATVGLDSMVPSGIYSKDNIDLGVEGIVLMRRGENPSAVLERVKKAAAELNDRVLPEGVKLASFYDRQHLVDSTLHTVGHSVLVGVTLVVLVLLLFLGRPSMAALVAVTIPFSLLFALVLMYFTNIPIGLLSIGAIDFGIIVDGAIIMAENIARRLGEAREKPTGESVAEIVTHAAVEVERPVFFSILMIVVAYLPLLSLTSIEGLLFRPMALTMVYALIGALIFALFVVPSLATVLYRRGYEEWENPVLTWIRPIYRLILEVIISGKWITLAIVLSALLFVGFRIVPKLGFEFLPYMDEGVVWIRANFPEGTLLEQTHAFGKRIREVIREFEDVEFVSAQAGRNDSGTDPFPPSRLEVMVGPKPRHQWKQFHTKQELVQSLGSRLREEFPTTRFNFTQPIIDSVTEDTNGTSANLAIEFSGPDSSVLLSLAKETVTLIRTIRGAQDVNVEQEGPQPQLIIIPDRQKCARYNVQVEGLTELINVAFGGEPISTLYEGERRFDVTVRLDRSLLSSPQAIGRIPVSTVDGYPVPLEQVARIDVADGQTIIARENSRRRMTVRCDIVGRDQGGFVREAQRLFSQKMIEKVPKGYDVEWLGMFANLARAQEHFALVIPISIVLIFLLLLVTFGSLKAAAVLLLSVPFALLGGILGLYLRGMNLNVSTGVGFAALFGVSIMNGVILVRAVRDLQSLGQTKIAAVLQGAQDCLRPILLASLVAILGLLPASIATGLGSDVQRPLATVIVWGLISSTLLTLFVLPVLYAVLGPTEVRRISGHQNGSAKQPALFTAAQPTR